VQRVGLDERVDVCHDRWVLHAPHALHLGGHFVALRCVEPSQRHTLHHENMAVAAPPHPVRAAGRARADELEPFVRLHRAGCSDPRSRVSSQPCVSRETWREFGLVFAPEKKIHQSELCFGCLERKSGIVQSLSSASSQFRIADP